MKFAVNKALLADAKESLREQKNIYWILGGAGSGKSTLSKFLSEKLGIPLYDMDTHIYGDYHGRFTEKRHPVNKAWANAENGLAWMLNMTWEEFHNFNQAALPEYVHLLVEDLEAINLDKGILIDGGIVNPALIAEVISPRQIICLARPERSSAEIWTENDERSSMKEYVFQLPNPEKMWRNFLEFDKLITETLITESQESNIAIASRKESESVEYFSERVARKLGIWHQAE
ncbi:MAG: hypothetical protein GY755_19045 [Chloroflexi bacterium]|nr:hypothetical protein [Chloroflexota bacterium]